MYNKRYLLPIITTLCIGFEVQPKYIPVPGLVDSLSLREHRLTPSEKVVLYALTNGFKTNSLWGKEVPYNTTYFVNLSVIAQHCHELSKDLMTSALREAFLEVEHPNYNRAVAKKNGVFYPEAIPVKESEVDEALTIVAENEKGNCESCKLFLDFLRNQKVVFAKAKGLIKYSGHLYMEADVRCGSLC